MNLTRSLSLGAALTALAAPALAQNDECSTAVSLMSGTPVAFDTTGATASPEVWPCASGGGPDLWYSFVSNGNPFEVAVCGSAYDTSLELFEGSCGNLASIDCNDDSCGLQSAIALVNPSMSTTYFVRVGGFNGATGQGSIEFIQSNTSPAMVDIVDNLPGNFIDISSTGTPLSLTDDGEINISTTVGNALLPAGTVRVGSNGGVQFLAGGFDGLSFVNDPLPDFGAFNFGLALLPFWDDIDTDGGIDGEIYWQEIGNQLIIQWEEVAFFVPAGGVAGDATFQIQVNASGSPVAQFLYQSVDSARADTGGSATIGLQSNDESTLLSNQWSFDTQGAVNNGDVLSIVAGPTGPGPIGTNYCMANINSTGVISEISATGSTTASDDLVTLNGANMPLNSLSIFITSMTQAFIPNPANSEGNLCLTGSIGRYNGAGQVLNSGMTGSITLDLDLTATPTPSGTVPVMAGQTWNFQAWHRDFTAGGAPTSNFTDGLSISFL